MTNQDYDDDLDKMFEDRARLAYKIENGTFSAIMRDICSAIFEKGRTIFVETRGFFDPRMQRIQKDLLAAERREANILAKRAARLEFLKREAAKEYYYRRDHE